MKFKSMKSALILSLVISAAAHAGKGYVCHTEQVVGFQGKANHWQPNVFNNRNVITVQETSPGGNFTVKSDSGYWYGLVDPGYGKKWKTSSGAALDKFTLNTDNMRFTAVYMGGYLTGEEDVTPMLMIGTCRAEKG